MAKVGTSLTQQQIDKLVKQVTKNVLLEEKQISIDQFKIICQNFLQSIHRQVDILVNRKNLIERIQAIGALMHDDVSSLQNILILSHTFESALNNFLGRTIPITWVSNTGNIKIAEESTVLSLYGSANLGLSAQHDLKAGISGRSYAGRIEGVNNKTFSKEVTDPKLKQLQEQINKSSENKKRVFVEAKRRYSNSPNMAYASNPKTSGTVQNIYWRVFYTNGSRLRHSQKIANAGYLGEGYVALILHTKNDVVNEKITFPSSKNAPPYNLIGQDYLRQLADYALQGDAIPGIVRGDINADETGNIQLAIKQGRNFGTASIAGNVAIAYAILYKSQNQLLNPQNIRKQLQNVNSTKWQAIFEALTGIAQKEIKNLDLKFILNL